MKAYTYDVFHRCDSIADWIPTNCSLALSSVQKVEGRYSIKLTSDAGVNSWMDYERTVDWSEFNDIVFWVYHPGWTNEKGRIELLTDLANYKIWEFDFAASWTEITIDLSSTPDWSEGTLDLSNITCAGMYIDCVTDPGEDFYFDFIHSRTIEVSAYMNDNRIYDGILPYKKRFTFTTHPTHWSYFNIENYIEIFDDTPTLRFAGWIKTKPQKVGDKFECPGLANEVFERFYDKSYTTDNTKEKLQDMTTNGLKFCSEGTYDATVLDWSYEYNRACAYLLNLTRWIERQVPYIKPDGEIMVKDYDGLIKGLQYYGATYINKPTVGLTGTDIPFVDSVELYDGACEIVSSWQSHKNVLRLLDDATAGEDPQIVHIITQATAGTREFYVGTNDVTEVWYIQFTEIGFAHIIWLKIENSKVYYYDSGDVWQEIQAVANDTLYHIKVQWYADNTFDVTVNGTLKVDGVACNNNQVSGINRFYLKAYGDSEDYLYLDAYGDPDNDAGYTVGDNYAAWSLGSHYQHVQLIDIPGIKERIPGYYKGNTGITSVPVRYINNTPIVRPAAPIEVYKTKSLNEFRDPKIQELATAQQIGDNLYAIFSLDTEFIGLRGEGLGWKQPGRTVQIQNNKQITITKNNFLLQRVIYDPKNDIHHQMILSNNIITPREFKNELDTSGQQIHTAVLQSCENQSEISKENYLEYDDDDPNAFEIIETDLTIDGNWNECDLDSYITVPSDAIGFFARVGIKETGGDYAYASFRHTSQSNSYQVAPIAVKGSTDWHQGVLPIPLDSNHKFDYQISANVDNFLLNVLWWIRGHT